MNQSPWRRIVSGRCRSPPFQLTVRRHRPRRATTVVTEPAQKAARGPAGPAAHNPSGVAAGRVDRGVGDPLDGSVVGADGDVHGDEAVALALELVEHDG